MIPEAAFTGETITHTDGLDYAVIDPTKLNFESVYAIWGKKVAPTRVRCAKAGEVIATRHKNSDGSQLVERDYVVQKDNELVFINEQPDGAMDVFAPPNAVELLQRNYVYIDGDPSSVEGALYQPTMKPVPLLHEANTDPVCIRNLYKEGDLVFFAPKATFKLQGGKVSGINKAAFDETWRLTDKSGHIRIRPPSQFFVR